MARFAGFSTTLFRGVFSYTLAWPVTKLVPQPPQHRASLVPRPSAGWPAVTAACQSPTARSLGEPLTARAAFTRRPIWAAVRRFAFGSANARLLSDCDGLGLIS